MLRPGFLDGIRVLDLTRVLAGPYCTALLSDLGAEVIKVEALAGDDYRQIGPFVDGRSILFNQVNRNKQSLAVDLKSPTGRDILRRLAARSDVVVENFRPGVATRLGVDHAALSKVNPGLVYASISGFGQESPFAERPAYDLVAQAMSGIMDLTGDPDGPPTKLGESFGDLCSGLFAAWGICAALVARAKTGLGAYLDVAMFDSLIALMPTPAALLLATGRAPTRVGNRHPLSTPFGAYQAKDGHFVLAVLTQDHFARLCKVMDRPELAGDPRLQSDGDRTLHEPLVRESVEGWSRQHGVAEVVAALSRAGIAAAPIWSIGQALGSEQVAARGLLAQPVDSAAPHDRVLRQPIATDGAVGAPRRAPEVGQHSSRVLAEVAGLSEAEIARLVAAGVVGEAAGEGS